MATWSREGVVKMASGDGDVITEHLTSCRAPGEVLMKAGSSGLLTRKEGTGVAGGEGIPAGGVLVVITGIAVVTTLSNVVTQGNDVTRVGEKEEVLSKGSSFIVGTFVATEVRRERCTNNCSRSLWILDAPIAVK